MTILASPCIIKIIKLKILVENSLDFLNMYYVFSCNSVSLDVKKNKHGHVHGIYNVEKGLLGLH